MPRSRLPIACVFALLIVPALCSAPAAEKSKPAAAKESAPAHISLITGDWRRVEKLVAGHPGKFVVVDVWTTTCGICVEEFPKFAALQKEFGDRVALIGVNCDYDGIESKPPAYYEPKVRDFLQSHNARFQNVLLNVSFIDVLEQLQLNSTPGVYVYGKDGKLLKRFDNDNALKVEDEFTIEDVSAYLKERMQAAP